VLGQLLFWHGFSKEIQEHVGGVSDSETNLSFETIRPQVAGQPRVRADYSPPGLCNHC
jgi:hypothetical protein